MSLEKPGRTRQEIPERWEGQSIVLPVVVEYSDGQVALAALQLLMAERC